MSLGACAEKGGKSWEVFELWGPSQSWGPVSGFLMGYDKGWAKVGAVGTRRTSMG